MPYLRFEIVRHKLWQFYKLFVTEADVNSTLYTSTVRTVRVHVDEELVRHSAIRWQSRAKAQHGKHLVTVVVLYDRADCGDRLLVAVGRGTDVVQGRRL